MGDFWYWFTSPSHAKRGMHDAREGLPKVGHDGTIHIPPHLDIIKDTYEAKMADVVGEWSKLDGDLGAKYATLGKRKENLARREIETSHALSLQYYGLVIFLALLEMPITFIALEGVFKENLVLVALSCVGFSFLIVWFGHVLGQRLYKEGVLEKSSRITVVFVVFAVLIVAGLSYFRYIHQSNQIFAEKIAIEEEAELAGASRSPQVIERIRHLDAKSPALISLVFFAMSAGFTLLATHASKMHCIKARDEKFLTGLNEFIEEKMVRIQKERETVYRYYDAQIDMLRQSAQREFAEYINGLIRSERNDGELMLGLQKTITEKFRIEVGAMLRTFLAVAQRLQLDIETLRAGEMRTGKQDTGVAEESTQAPQAQGSSIGV